MRTRTKNARLHVEAQTRTEIVNAHAMTPAEIRAELEEAWKRATDPEAVAAEVAARGPAPLRAKNGKPARPITVTDADGKPIKIVPSSQLLQGLLEREGVTDAVVEDGAAKPRTTRCVECRKPVLVPKFGFVLRCEECSVERRRERDRRRAREWAEANPEAAKEKRRRYKAARREREQVAERIAKRKADADKRREARETARRETLERRRAEREARAGEKVVHALGCPVCGAIPKQIPGRGRPRKFCDDHRQVKRRRR